MARGGFSQPGQRENITRGERTDPRIILFQAICLVLVVLIAFIVIRAYIWQWERITRNHLHSWLAPVAIILVAGCVAAGIMLFVELYDANWPNPRDASPSTRPNFPWSKERFTPSGGGGVNVVKVTDLLARLDSDLTDDDEEWNDNELD